MTRGQSKAVEKALAAILREEVTWKPTFIRAILYELVRDVVPGDSATREER